MKANVTNKAYLFRMNKKGIGNALHEISETDKRDLQELMLETIGESKRIVGKSNDKREFIPLFHERTKTYISAEGKAPEEIEVFPKETLTVKRGNWSLDIFTTQIVAEYADWWCPQQTACLNYKDERMALLTNDSTFFKNSFVISLSTSFSEELANFLNTAHPNLQMIPYTEEDFACTAEYGISKQMFEKSAQYSYLKLENMVRRFKEKKEIDTTTPFKFKKEGREAEDENHR